MTTNTRKLLLPQYLHNFRCIGPDCEDSCCIGWKVMIDKSTYQNYRKCPDGELRLQMDKQVTRNRTNADASNYAKIKLDKDGACPFIADDKLCKIQRKLGEPYLSLTCTSYPRTTNIINGVLEKSLAMSCPEATRLALLNPNPMEFDEAEEATDIRCLLQKELNTSDKRLAHRPEKFFWELRIFIIYLLQNRSYQLWQRLVILGFFCNNLSQLVDEGNYNEIPKLIGTYLNRLDNDSYTAEMQSISSRLTIQMELIKSLVDMRMSGGATNQRFLVCFEEFLKGIHYATEGNKEEIEIEYAKAYEAYYKPFMQEHEYILENYLVNFVFMNLFPFSGEKNIFDNYVMLIVHYAMIKVMLIGMSGFHKEDFNTAHVLTLIQSFSKSVEHNKDFLKQAFKLLKEHKMNTLAYMAILVKN